MTTQRILVLDFDGTVCRGDEPVRAYARLAAAGLEPADAGWMSDALEAFLDGTDRDGVTVGAQDGYQAVTALAAHLHIPPERIGQAFLACRAALANGEIPAELPTGLLDLLSEVRPRARVVLVTNAPGDSLAPLVDRLGLTPAVDEVVADAHKPAGLPAVLERLLEQADALDAPQRLLSVGDIWANDLQPAGERGCRTAYVDRFDRRQGEADVSAPVIEDLYDHIRSWALSSQVKRDHS